MRRRFDNATFARSASSFDNPDHIDIVIHNYRWRLGVAEGESKYADLEGQLAKAPSISVGGGVGHYLPQKTPQAFFDAIVEVDCY